MSKLLSKWRTAREDLGLEIVAPYEVHLDNGLAIRAEILVRHFGAPNGMVVVSNYASVWANQGRLVQLGYGFSVLDENDEPYDRNEFIGMLSDWGWSGPEDQKPDWIIDSGRSGDSHRP